METIKIQEAQRVLLKILKEVDTLCRKHNITYWIDGGTLLGAIRNKKFIPWDDDVDICLPIDNFYKLQKVIREELLPTHPNYILYNDSRPFPHYSEYLGDVSYLKNRFYPVQIDIVKVKSIPNTPKAINIDKEHVSLLSFLYGYSNDLQVQNKNLYHQAIERGAWLFRRERYLKIFTQYINSCNSISKDNLYCYPYNDMYVSKTREYYVYDDIFPVKEIEFEGQYFFAPNNTEAYLTKLYTKNFMTPPPKEEQTSFSKQLSKGRFSRKWNRRIIYILYFLKAIKASYKTQRRIMRYKKTILQ